MAGSPTKGPLQPDPLRDPSRAAPGVARAVLSATAAGVPRALPKEDAALIARFDRQQEALTSLLPPVRGATGAPGEAKEVKETKEASVEGVAPEEAKEAGSEEAVDVEEE